MLPTSLRLPQVFVPPRQCTDHWRCFEGGRQALVNTFGEIGLCGQYREVAALWRGWRSSVAGTVAKHMILRPQSYSHITGQLMYYNDPKVELHY